MSDGNPKKDLIEQAVERKAAAGIPIPKYTLVVEITGNSRDEIASRVHMFANDWEYSYSTRDAIDSTDGTTSVVMEHTSPEQTPDRYSDELAAWSDARRAKRLSESVS